MGVLRKCFQEFWSSSGWSGRSRMSKNWGFVGFWVSWWGFCHCNPIYDTILESLRPWEYSGSFSRNFGHHQDDQEGQEYPKTGDLEDFWCLDGYFAIVTTHIYILYILYILWLSSGLSVNSGISSKCLSRRQGVLMNLTSLNIDFLIIHSLWDPSPQNL